jgi:hypothetical protein
MLDLPTEDQLFRLNKEELVSKAICFAEELATYKRKMLSKKDVIERYGKNEKGEYNITESCLNKWMSKGRISYQKFGEGKKAKVFFPLDELVKLENSKIIKYKPVKKDENE